MSYWDAVQVRGARDVSHSLEYMGRTYRPQLRNARHIFGDDAMAAMRDMVYGLRNWRVILLTDISKQFV